MALNTFMSATLLNLLFYSSSSRRLKSEDKWLTEQIQERFPEDSESKNKKVRIKFCASMTKKDKINKNIFVPQ